MTVHPLSIRHMLGGHRSKLKHPYSCSGVPPPSFFPSYLGRSPGRPSDSQFSIYSFLQFYPSIISWPRAAANSHQMRRKAALATAVVALACCIPHAVATWQPVPLPSVFASELPSSLPVLMHDDATQLSARAPGAMGRRQIASLEDAVPPAATSAAGAPSAAGQAAAEPVGVSTALELQAAVVNGTEHIEILTHLDLTDLELVDGSLLGTLPESVKSIRVRRHVPCHPERLNRIARACDWCAFVPGR